MTLSLRDAIPNTDDAPLRLLVFGADAAEAAQIRRMRSYLDCGFDVTGFMMRRANMNRDFVPFWDNVHLFETANESPLRRIAAVGRSIRKLGRYRDRMQGADVIVARNLDMLAIAASARARLRPRPALIYECLDIHGLMTDPGPKGQLMRAAERRLLAQCSGLILSSPGFLREYFEPVQGWTGPTALVENKIWIGPDGPARPRPGTRPRPPTYWTPDRPLVLGWVGTLRCARSLSLLAAVANHFGPRLQLQFHGAVHHHAVPDFEVTLARHPNMTWSGPYDYPDGLDRIYGACDLVWSQDLWQWGTNSTWLLPNRIYEASYFGCPSLAVDGTETGRRVADGLGWTIPRPDPDALIARLETLSPTQIADQRDALLRRPDTDFRQSSDDIAAAIRMPFTARP
ncbi:MAG: glycosyl transferase [Marinibacterium sp.]|nr:glycosyl transferase [Marinibacterium sp.]